MNTHGCSRPVRCTHPQCTLEVLMFSSRRVYYCGKTHQIPITSGLYTSRDHKRKIIAVINKTSNLHSCSSGICCLYRTFKLILYCVSMWTALLGLQPLTWLYTCHSAERTLLQQAGLPQTRRNMFSTAWEADNVKAAQQKVNWVGWLKFSIYRSYTFCFHLVQFQPLSVLCPILSRGPAPSQLITVILRWRWWIHSALQLLDTNCEPGFCYRQETDSSAP